MTSYKIIVSGKVQGVYYRKTIAQKANKLGYKGFVRNMPDGTVEVGVMLNESNYDRFLAILKQGSSYSKVANLQIKKTNETFYGFKIRY